MINTHDIDANDFKSSFPAGAAHAASEVDDYDGAAPEGAAIASLWLITTLAIGALTLWTVFG